MKTRINFGLIGSIFLLLVGLFMVVVSIVGFFQ